MVGAGRGLNARHTRTTLPQSSQPRRSRCDARLTEEGAESCGVSDAANTGNGSLHTRGFPRGISCDLSLERRCTLSHRSGTLPRAPG